MEMKVSLFIVVLQLPIKSKRMESSGIQRSIDNFSKSILDCSVGNPNNCRHLYIVSKQCDAKLLAIDISKIQSVTTNNLRQLSVYRNRTEAPCFLTPPEDEGLSK